MINFSVVAQNLGEAVSDLRKFLEKDRGTQFVTVVSKAATQILKTNAPRSKSGRDHAADHFNYTVEKTPRGTEGIVYLERGYEYLILTSVGTPPHLIKGHPLRWYDEVTNQPVFAEFVVHPGIVGTRWIEKSTDQVGVVAGLLQVELAKEFRR